MGTGIVHSTNDKIFLITWGFITLPVSSRYLEFLYYSCGVIIIISIFIFTNIITKTDRFAQAEQALFLVFT